MWLIDHNANCAFIVAILIDAIFILTLWRKSEGFRNLLVFLATDLVKMWNKFVPDAMSAAPARPIAWRYFEFTGGPVRQRIVLAFGLEFRREETRPEGILGPVVRQ
jgi:hypothetical protein